MSSKAPLEPITALVTTVRAAPDLTASKDEAWLDVNMLIATLTLSVWLGCLAIGMVGAVIRYPRFQFPAPMPPVAAQVIHVELTEDQSSPGTDAGSDQEQPLAQPDVSPPVPPALPQSLTPPAAPPMATVAAPSPEIAFAVPVQGPTRTVDARQAVPVAARPDATGTGPPAAVRHLRFGHGEGAQPSPEYPREAQLEREEGVVVVRFTVDEAGKVTTAEAATPSRWPILNQAAIRAVRDRWHFDPGPARAYEVSIEFKLL